MVTSLTALRTRIRQKYAVSANKLPSGLFVPVHLEHIDAEDIATYQVTATTGGSLWQLPTAALGAALGSNEPIYIKPLPRTMSAFIQRGLKQGLFEIVSSKTYSQTYPETIEQLTHIDLYHSGFGKYTCYTIKLLQGDESVLSNLTYCKDSEQENVYRVYFCTSHSRGKQLDIQNTLYSMLTFFITALPPNTEVLTSLEALWKESFARFGTIGSMRKALEQGVSLQLLLDNPDEFE